jgi:hypothetical protein
MTKYSGAERRKMVRYRDCAVKKQKNKCYWCNTKFTKKIFPTADHVISFYKGGKASKENIVAACYQCNCVERGQDQFFWSKVKHLPKGIEDNVSVYQYLSIITPYMNIATPRLVLKIPKRFKDD